MTTLSIELANEGDITSLAKLYCESFRELFRHIGLPPDTGPAVIEAMWRASGTLTVRRYTLYVMFWCRPFVIEHFLMLVV